MGNTTIRSRIDSETKQEAQALFEKLGLTMSDAIRLFLHQAVLENGIPFQVRLPDDAAHDIWFRRQVEAELEEADKPGATFIPHEEVSSRWAKKRRALLGTDGRASEA